MKFSVVVIAHKRKDFILYAVRSVLEQTYPSDDLEIIVIKSFQDTTLDQSLSRMGAFLIYTDKIGLSDKTKLGILRSSGDIICFLEDDDYFCSQKLSRLAQLLESNPSLDYIHNEQVSVSNNVVHYHSFYSTLSKGFFLDRSKISMLRLINMSLHFNLSSLSISRRLGKEIVRLLPDDLANVVDLSILLIAYEMSDSKIYFTEKRLTAFRVHESSHLSFGDFEYFSDFEETLSEIEFKELKTLMTLTKSLETRYCIECLKNSWKLRKCIFSKSQVRLSQRFEMLVVSYLCTLQALSLASTIEIVISLLNFISPTIASRFFYALRKIKAL